MKNRLIIIIVPLLLSASPAMAGQLPGPYATDLVRVIDGDTIVARIHLPEPAIAELGLLEDVRVSGVASIRISGVDTPEIFQPKAASKIYEMALGLAAMDFVEGLLSTGILTVENLRPGAYGRVDADVYADGKPVADSIIAAGHGKPSTGTRVKGLWCED